MADERLDRRLSAVLAADVAGYSRLVGVDITRVRQLDGKLTLSTMPARMSLRRPQDRVRMLDALRKAGLTE